MGGPSGARENRMPYKSGSRWPLEGRDTGGARTPGNFRGAEEFLCLCLGGSYKGVYMGKKKSLSSALKICAFYLDKLHLNKEIKSQHPAP